ncbi:MAG: hypothetical protein SFX72_13420 [Isosphaeraceae bacterium]|nr:hypothetical protein [Isosphaeraceae bacterium]
MESLARMIINVHSHSIRLARRSLASALVAAACAAAAGGCGFASAQPELVGPAALERLPESVRGLVPSDSILAHEEEGRDGGYRLWILRKPGGSRIEFPRRDRKHTDYEHHDLPASALLGLIQAKAPQLERGTPVDPKCRFTHWTATDRAEIQMRELITDRGWFASIERLEP